MNEEILFAREDEIDPNNPLPADDTVDSQKYLIFMADDLKMGVVAEDVVEILTNQPITYLPMLPEFIRGIINMRGQMVPIVDIRIRLGHPPREDSLVVVLIQFQTRMGIVTDGPIIDALAWAGMSSSPSMVCV